jgi:hypothetical protein
VCRTARVPFKTKNQCVRVKRYRGGLTNNFAVRRVSYVVGVSARARVTGARPLLGMIMCLSPGSYDSHVLPRWRKIACAL